MKSNKKLKLVFIAGLGHSGSTLFDLLLGAQHNTMGLGEIDVYINKEKRDWFLQRYDKYPCTCKLAPSQCSVWGNFKDYIEKNFDKSYARIYRQLIEIVLEKTESNIIVDSSKNIHALQRVFQSLPEIGLSKSQFLVIHLVKDIRSFTTSSLQTSRSQSVIRTAKNWMKANKRIEQYVKNHNIKALNIGYDELTLSTEYIMKRVYDFISDQHNCGVSLDLSTSDSHIISGNKMRLDQADSIQYDYRWFNNWKINLLYSLVPQIRQFNENWVFGNVDHFMDKQSRFEPPNLG